MVSLRVAANRARTFARPSFAPERSRQHPSAELMVPRHFTGRRGNAANSLTPVKERASRESRVIYTYICTGGCPTKHPSLISIASRVRNVCTRTTEARSVSGEGGNVSDSLAARSRFGPGARRENGSILNAVLANTIADIFDPLDEVF